MTATYDTHAIAGDYDADVNPQTVVPAGRHHQRKPAVPVRETAPPAVAPTTTVAPAAANQPKHRHRRRTAPPGETTVVVDIPIPDYPPLPEGPAPEDTGPPEPQDPDPEPADPPILDIPDFTPPEVSKPTRIANLNPQRDQQEPTLDSRFESIEPKKKPANKRMNPIGP